MNQCTGCKNYDPKRHYCFRFLCGAEKVKRCDNRDDLEMKEVDQMDMAYLEYFND